MRFLPDHVSPVLLALVAMGVAGRLGLGRWWLVGVPALLGVTAGFVVEITGASVHEIPLVPFVVEIATIATVCGLALPRPAASTL